MDINIPSPICAYGLRKLFNSYSGNSIRVRRESDNAEQDIPFNKKGNLDVLSLMSFAANSACFIVVEYDQSGNNKNKIDEIAANQKRICWMLTAKQIAEIISLALAGAPDEEIGKLVTRFLIENGATQNDAQ